MAAAAFACVSCGESFRVLSNQAGLSVRCPHCRATNPIPARLFNKQPEPARPGVASAPSPLSQLASQVVSAGAAGILKVRARSHGRLTGNFRYTHSVFARRIDSAALVLLGLACVVQVYIFLMTEWGDITSLPFKLALPTIAVLFVPAAIIAITGGFLMAAAQCTEYLARIASQPPPARERDLARGESAVTELASTRSPGSEATP
jgi:hypothetical protein